MHTPIATYAEQNPQVASLLDERPADADLDSVYRQITAGMESCDKCAGGVIHHVTTCGLGGVGGSVMIDTECPACAGDGVVVRLVIAGTPVVAPVIDAYEVIAAGLGEMEG